MESAGIPHACRRLQPAMRLVRASDPRAPGTRMRHVGQQGVDGRVAGRRCVAGRGPRGDQDLDGAAVVAVGGAVVAPPPDRRSRAGSGRPRRTRSRSGRHRARRAAADGPGAAVHGGLVERGEVAPAAGVHAPCRRRAGPAPPRCGRAARTARGASRGRRARPSTGEGASGSRVDSPRATASTAALHLVQLGGGAVRGEQLVGRPDARTGRPARAGGGRDVARAQRQVHVGAGVEQQPQDRHARGRGRSPSAGSARRRRPHRGRGTSAARRRPRSRACAGPGARTRARTARRGSRGPTARRRGRRRPRRGWRRGRAATGPVPRSWRSTASNRAVCRHSPPDSTVWLSGSAPASSSRPAQLPHVGGGAEAAPQQHQQRGRPSITPAPRPGPRPARRDHPGPAPVRRRRGRFPGPAGQVGPAAKPWSRASSARRRRAGPRAPGGGTGPARAAPPARDGRGGEHGELPCRCGRAATEPRTAPSAQPSAGPSGVTAVERDGHPSRPAAAPRSAPPPPARRTRRRCGRPRRTARR